MQDFSGITITRGSGQGVADAAELGELWEDNQCRPWEWPAWPGECCRTEGPGGQSHGMGGAKTLALIVAVLHVTWWLSEG